MSTTNKELMLTFTDTDFPILTSYEPTRLRTNE